MSKSSFGPSTRKASYSLSGKLTLRPYLDVDALLLAAVSTCCVSTGAQNAHAMVYVTRVDFLTFPYFKISRQRNHEYEKKKTD